MSWRDLFKIKPAEPTENRACSFCKKSRVEVWHLVAGPGVSICNECIVLAGAVSDEAAGGPRRTWAQIVAQMALQSLPTEWHLIEPLARSACALWNGDVAGLRDLANTLHAGGTASHARAELIAWNTIPAGARTTDDLQKMFGAAMIAGDLDAASRVFPVGQAERPITFAFTHLVPLLRARPGDPAIDDLGAQVREARRLLPADAPEVERISLDTTLAIAELRAGRPAGALSHYQPYRALDLLPWHVLAIGEAMHALGDVGGARVEWEKIAKRDEAPYWRDEAQRLLGRLADPYR